MGTLYLRVPADDGITLSGDGSPDAVLDDDPDTAWSTAVPAQPGYAIVIDRGDGYGSGRLTHMIDGAESTSWSFGLPQVPAQAITIDRGDDADPCNRIQFTSGADHPDDYPRTVNLLASTDGSSWTTLTSAIIDGQDVELDFATTSARYLKIVNTATADDPWTIAEIGLQYVDAFGTTDLSAFGWTLSASGSVAEGLPVFNQIVIDAGTASEHYPRAYTVHTSNDATTWTLVATETANTALTSTAVFTLTSARYIKVTNTAPSPYPWTIANLLARHNTGGETTTDLDRSAWRADVAELAANSSDHWVVISVDGAGPAVNAAAVLDGSPLTTWSTNRPALPGDCLILDAGSSLDPYNQVVVDSGPQYTENVPTMFQVLVSDDADTWTFAGSAVAGESGEPARSVILDPARTQRYIKILVEDPPESNRPWTVATVTVFNGDLPLDTAGWTVTAPGIGGPYPDATSTLRLKPTDGYDWLRHVAPGATGARPFKLRMPDHTWQTVLHLTAAEPYPWMYYTQTGMREDHESIPTPGVDTILTSASNPLLVAGAFGTERWTRAFDPPEMTDPQYRVGDQLRIEYSWYYLASTVQLYGAEQLADYWQGYPVTGLRYNFQVQKYYVNDFWAPEDGPVLSTFDLYRHDTPPAPGDMATPESGTLVHTFIDIPRDIPTGLEPSGEAPTNRGPMFSYEVSPVDWAALPAFSLYPSWYFTGDHPPYGQPGGQFPELPLPADGLYVYGAGDQVTVNMTVEVILDAS